MRFDKPVVPVTRVQWGNEWIQITGDKFNI